MRDYRGQTKDGRWVKGWYAELNGNPRIYPFEELWQPYPVIPSTVGQSTGPKDKNGVEIYEGDIVGFKPHNGYIIYEDGTFKIRFKEAKICESPEQCPLEGYRHNIEVIGNIHDNPELLKGNNV